MYDAKTLRIARVYLARDFSSPEALEEYMEEHPNAKRENHQVVKPQLSLQKKKLDQALTKAQDLLMTPQSRDRELEQLSHAVIKEKKSMARKLMDSVKSTFAQIGDDAKKSCSTVSKLLSGNAQDITAAEVKGTAKTTVLVLSTVLTGGAANAIGPGLCALGQSLGVKVALNGVRALFTGNKAVDVGAEIAEIVDDINDVSGIAEHSLKIADAVAPLLEKADLLKDTGDFLTSVFASEETTKKEPSERDSLKTQAIIVGIAIASLQSVAKKGLKEEEIEKLLEDQSKLNDQKEKSSDQKKATKRVASRYLNQLGYR